MHFHVLSQFHSATLIFLFVFPCLRLGTPLFFLYCILPVVIVLLCVCQKESNHHPLSVSALGCGSCVGEVSCLFISKKGNKYREREREREQKGVSPRLDLVHGHRNSHQRIGQTWVESNSHFCQYALPFFSLRHLFLIFRILLHFPSPIAPTPTITSQIPHPTASQTRIYRVCLYVPK